VGRLVAVKLLIADGVFTEFKDQPSDWRAEANALTAMCGRFPPKLAEFLSQRFPRDGTTVSNTRIQDADAEDFPRLLRVSDHSDSMLYHDDQD
jgi:hypothetical protein